MMISELKKKIFLIIFISLSAIVISITIIFASVIRNNIVNSSYFVLENLSKKENGNGNKEREDDEKILKDADDFEDIYIIGIENNKVVYSNNSFGTEIKSAVDKIIKNPSSNRGSVDKYIYMIKENKGNSYIIILSKNQEMITKIKMVYIAFVLAVSLLIFLMYLIANKISRIIVKPVEETIEKQKQFISDASHELKTPLAVIAANVDVVESEFGKNKWITYIQEEVSRMSKLVNDLLILTRFEDKKEKEVYELSNISEEISLTTSIFESIAFENKIIIKTNINDNIMFKCDRNDIRQLVSILLDNGIKHTSENEDIIVELNKVKNDIILKVKNKGNEIPIEDREKIFQRFYRVDKSRNRNENRYGLGLSIAKAIVDRYNGKISVGYESGYTTFKVIL